MTKKFFKKLLYPGLDLHTRSRFRLLPPHFLKGNISTLDVGCGNGALCYAAYKKGNRVLGINYSIEEVRRNTDFFGSLDNLQFKVLNLYDLLKINSQFDQIICSETLEHIKDDKLIVKYLYRLLKQDGVLHLCCPNAKHPLHNLGRTDNPEDGGHVRDGYTRESYALLLEPAGFQIVESAGVGTPALVKWDNAVRFIRSHFGDLVALPFFLIGWPFLRLIDKSEAVLPFSIYIKAIKK